MPAGCGPGLSSTSTVSSAASAAPAWAACFNRSTMPPQGSGRAWLHQSTDVRGVWQHRRRPTMATPAPTPRGSAVPIPETTTQPDVRQVPSRWSAAVFAGKAALLQLRRGVQDLGGRQRRLARDGRPSSADAVASSRTPLWSDTRSAELGHQLGKIHNLRRAARMPHAWKNGRNRTSLDGGTSDKVASRPRKSENLARKRRWRLTRRRDGGDGHGVRVLGQG